MQRVVALTDGDVANDRKGGLVRVSLRVVAHSVDADHASGHVSRSSTGRAPTSAAARTASLLAHKDSSEPAASAAHVQGRYEAKSLR